MEKFEGNPLIDFMNGALPWVLLGLMLLLAILYLNKEEAKEYLDHFTVEGVVALKALQERITKINDICPNIIAVLKNMTNYFNGRDSLDKVIELF